MQKLLTTTALTAAAQTDTVQETTYRVVSWTAAFAAGMLTRKVLTKAWTATAGAPPRDPSDADVAWQDALVWAAATGVGVGVGRVVGRRLTASAWEKATGEPAPRTTG